MSDIWPNIKWLTDVILYSQSLRMNSLLYVPHDDWNARVEACCSMRNVNLLAASSPIRPASWRCSKCFLDLHCCITNLQKQNRPNTRCPVCPLCPTLCPLCPPCPQFGLSGPHDLTCFLMFSATAQTGMRHDQSPQVSHGESPWGLTGSSQKCDKRHWEKDWRMRRLVITTKPCRSMPPAFGQNRARTDTWYI